KVMWISLVVLFSDQLSKYLARQANVGVLNHGGIFGLFPGTWWILLMGAVLTVMFILLVTRKNENNIQKLGWSIIIGAGIGNLIDRFIWGGVWDFIYYPVINVVGNIADVWLGVGFIVLLLSELRRKPV